MHASRHDSFINLDMHCREGGRCLVQIGLEHLTPTEREWMFARLSEAKEGREIEFGAKTLEGGTIVFTFAIAPRFDSSANRLMTLDEIKADFREKHPEAP